MFDSVRVFDEDDYEAYTERRLDAVANGFDPDSEADMVAYDQMMSAFDDELVAEFGPVGMKSQLSHLERIEMVENQEFAAESTILAAWKASDGSAHDYLGKLRAGVLAEVAAECPYAIAATAEREQSCLREHPGWEI